jgi:RNA polymerase sigma-70 factor, ECF subfamily
VIVLACGAGAAGEADRCDQVVLHWRFAMMEDHVAHLIQQIAAGDRAAFRELYLATSDTLFGVLIRMLRNRANADEGLQEVFARVWLRAGSFAPTRGSGMTWLMTIARNYAIDQRRHRQLVEMEQMEIEQIVDPRRGPDDYLVAQGVVERIVLCLATLEPKHADCIKRAYLDGASYAELAARHAVPVNTMRTWLRRGLQKLRACVAE